MNPAGSVHRSLSTFSLTGSFFSDLRPKRSRFVLSGSPTSWGSRLPVVSPSDLGLLRPVGGGHGSRDYPATISSSVGQPMREQWQKTFRADRDRMTVLKESGRAQKEQET